MGYMAESPISETPYLSGEFLNVRISHTAATDTVPLILKELHRKPDK